MHPIFDHFDTRSTRTKELEEQITAFEIELINSIYEHQLSCKHKHIAEAPWQQREYTASSPEERVCLNCGLSEIGWGIGFQTLTHKHPVTISRDDLLALCRGTRLFEHQKVKLLRKETTLQELIDELRVERLMQM